jgi:hypothetical protein
LDFKKMTFVNEELIFVKVNLGKGE